MPICLAVTSYVTLRFVYFHSQQAEVEKIQNELREAEQQLLAADETKYQEGAQLCIPHKYFDTILFRASFIYQ